MNATQRLFARAARWMPLRADGVDENEARDPGVLKANFFAIVLNGFFLGRREFHLDLKALGLLLVRDAIAPLIGMDVGQMGRSSGKSPGFDHRSDREHHSAGVCVNSDDRLWVETVAVAVLAGFGAMAFATGFGGAGVDLASKNFILELAPNEECRPVFIGVNDTLVAVPTLYFAGGGAVIDRRGFQPVFVATVACSSAAALLGFTLRARRSRGGSRPRIGARLAVTLALRTSASASECGALIRLDQQIIQVG